MLFDVNEFGRRIGNLQRERKGMLKKREQNRSWIEENEKLDAQRQYVVIGTLALLFVLN